MTQFGSVGELDYFKQSIFNHRIGKPGRNIRNQSAFFLRLFDFGIHKYGAARTKIDGVLGKERFFGKILYGIIERFGERFDKGTAA